MKESDDNHTPGCSAFFVPADIVQAWRRNQRVMELDRPADKQLADKVVSLQQAIERDVEPPTGKQMIVTRRLGAFLTRKKTRNVDDAFTAPSNVATVGKQGEIAMSKDECFLSQIPPSYRLKAKKTHGRVVSERHDVERQWQHLFKGEACERSQSTITPSPRIIRETAQPTHWLWPRGPAYDCGTPTSTVYANPRWTWGSWDNYVPSESSTQYYTDATDDTDDTVTERNVTRDAFPEWEDLA